MVLFEFILGWCIVQFIFFERIGTNENLDHESKKKSLTLKETELINL